eukprot:3836205-Prymnesium_polylepis.3
MRVMIFLLAVRPVRNGVTESVGAEGGRCQVSFFATLHSFCANPHRAHTHTGLGRWGWRQR